MSLTYNATEVQGVTYNGAEVQSITYNGTEIWDAISKNLNEVDWATILAETKAGRASNHWKVGDTKDVYLKGTVGSLAIDGTYRAVILGFNHNASIEGNNTIHFAICKNTSGNNIAFCDSKYWAQPNDSIHFTPWTPTKSMHWGESAFRDVIQQFLNVMPQELSSIIKSTTKWTKSRLRETASNDKISLLSSTEVGGVGETLDETYYHGDPYITKESEGLTAQYDYFRGEGGSHSKFPFFMHNNLARSVVVWLRNGSTYTSTDRADHAQLYDVWREEKLVLSDGNAKVSLAVIPIFAIG